MVNADVFPHGERAAVPDSAPFDYSIVLRPSEGDCLLLHRLSPGIV